MDTADPAWTVGLTEARTAARDAPDVTLTLDADASLRLTVFPGQDEVGPFVALRLGRWVVLIVHQIEAATRLAALATEAGHELQRLSLTRPQDSASGPVGEEP